jgi:hypothetical protein
MSIKITEHVEVDTQHEMLESSNLSAQTRRVSLQEAAAVVVPARYVLLCLATAITGYTVKAMQRKIERGDWQEGKLWKRAPDGRILIDLTGYQKWVEGQ